MASVTFTLVDLYYLVQWKQITPYTTFSSVSATRQKVAMKLQQLGLLEFEPFLTVTPLGNTFLEVVEAHADLMAHSHG